ncbi:hypothetical protein FH972_023843 [Carpinus fangiana]|uniref:Coupling of ubiquitin conjugation to ER degradation protein 1 n=1 Tax=Carpinus fangiana TaxID=176857 RepID=A0A5N6KYV0_9ROSI|nr:hypothetical protein FH972_023843 [Carpinus fangiana]
MPIAYHKLTPVGVFGLAITALLACYIPITVLLAATSPNLPPDPTTPKATTQPTTPARGGRSTSTMDDPQQTTLNIPSLLAFALLSFFAIRYFFYSPASSTSAAASRAYPGRAARTRPVSPEKIEIVHSMFPQVDRRRIEWDLVRNGGSVQATTEKVLREGRLDEPPPNFRAQAAPASAAAGSTAGASSGRRGGAAQSPAHADLITRYNLSSRLTEQEAVQQLAEKEKQKQSWSTSKVDRQALLKRRREEMVLNARRKMEAQLKGEGKGAAA